MDNHDNGQIYDEHPFMRAKRTIFYISDGTGITAETIGHSVLTQFDGIDFCTRRIPFVDTAEKAHAAVTHIKQAMAQEIERPIVINSVIDMEISNILADSGVLSLDVLAPFIEPLERELNMKRSRHIGQAHGMVNFKEYEQRINATNFALSHDDGMRLTYHDADVILVGVSRSGKTPTCLYLALHFGVCAANYPLTDDDLDRQELPTCLAPHQAKLFGLTIDPTRLQQIRHNRKPNSRYATLEQCRAEVGQAEKLFKAYQIPMLSTTHTSIEEIASKIMATLGINKHLY